MIPKSTTYKLVRIVDNVIIAEGSKKNIDALARKTPGTYKAISHTLKVGDVFPL